MSKKKEPLDQSVQIPVTRSLKSELEAVAESEERKLSEMGRILWREALAARRESGDVTMPEQQSSFPHPGRQSGTHAAAVPGLLDAHK